VLNSPCQPGRVKTAEKHSYFRGRGGPGREVQRSKPSIDALAEEKGRMRSLQTEKGGGGKDRERRIQRGGV